MDLPAAVPTDPADAYVEVSPEMTMVLGAGPGPAVPLPPEPMTLCFVWGMPGQQPRLKVVDGVMSGAAPAAPGTRLSLVVQRSAYMRVGGRRTPRTEGEVFHLPSPLQAIAVALRDCQAAGEARKVYRLAKSLELLMEAIRLDNEGYWVAMGGQGTLSFADTQRVLAARRLIDERWSEQLTLQAIARTCGLNRAKLTAAFRELFHCSIGEALATKRLEEARRMLLTTDLPVSSVGYRNGYQNNAAFSRAFSRRFGVPPTGFRACPRAA